MRFIKYLLYLALALSIVWLMLWAIGQKKFKTDFGISFNQNHATSLGLDWRQVYTDMLAELKPKYVRVAAMWSEIEPTEGTYDFTDVDYMMQQAAKHDAEVVLVVGQKAPRWPECHVPEWVSEYDRQTARERLLAYVKSTVERYKNHSALEFWQVENEPFIPFEFGECAGFDKQAISEEIALVHQLDPSHDIIVTDSGELSTWRKAAQTGDIFGTTLYRVVRTPGGRVIKYDWLPAGFYRLKAKLWGITRERFFISELQAEPWFADSTPLDTPVTVQEETMNPRRLIRHIDFATHVGATRAYLWGVEWWYFMKEVHGDARYWEIVRDQLVIGK